MDSARGREFFKNRKVLVTGGAGFIGSHVVNALLDLRASVTVLDDFSTGSRKNLPAHPKLNVVRGDITKAETVHKLVHRSAFVFHEASRNILSSLSDPIDDGRVNIMGTLHVLMAIKRSSPACRLVYASTDSLYGNSRYLPINEEDGTNPLNPYSVSKLAGENYCRAFYESFGISTVVLRYANVFGPCHRLDGVPHNVTSRFIECALSGKPLTVHGDGEQTRDFIFVEDVVEATLLAAVTSKSEGQVYNVGSGFETTIDLLARKTVELAGCRSTIVFEDRKDIDNIRRRVLNIERIRKDMRWAPTYTLEHGLKQTIRWYQEHGIPSGR